MGRPCSVAPDTPRRADLQTNSRSPVSYAYWHLHLRPHPSSFSAKNTRPQFILARRAAPRSSSPGLYRGLYRPLIYRPVPSGGIRKRGITAATGLQIIPRGQRVVVVAAPLKWIKCAACFPRRLMGERKYCRFQGSVLLLAVIVKWLILRGGSGYKRWKC